LGERGVLVRNLFAEEDRAAIQSRLAQLAPSASRQWGKMDAAQMMEHCARALEVGTGETPRTQALIGKIFAPFVRKSLLGDKPFGKNSPTDPTFVVHDPKDFEAAKKRLAGLIDRFAAAGPASAGAQTHSFLGRMSGEEWAVMMYKHLDHHLRQFGA
jgi:Protein of unknown function (DUF1569)